MDIKRWQIGYRIEAKPEGGFVARSSDPSQPNLEAATIEEIREKVRSATAAAAAAAMGFKIPFDRLQPGAGGIYLERKQVSGFGQKESTQVIEHATHEQVEQFAQEFSGLMMKDFPELAAALVNRSKGAIPSGNGTDSTPKSGSHLSLKDLDGTNDKTSPDGRNFPTSSPIVPEGGGTTTIIQVFLAVLIIAVIVMIFLHHR